MASSETAMTYTEVAEILRIVESAPRGGEVSIELGDSVLHVRTAGTNAAPTPAAAASAPPAPAVSAPVATEPVAETKTPAPAGATGSQSAAAPSRDGLVAVTAPMTGVFYTAPAPGEPAFVAVGDRVEAKQDVAIIEVMKLMNRLSTPCAGVVREIAVANEELVEIDAAVMWIEPDEPAAAGDAS